MPGPDLTPLIQVRTDNANRKQDTAKFAINTYYKARADKRAQDKHKRTEGEAKRKQEVLDKYGDMTKKQLVDIKDQLTIEEWRFLSSTIAAVAQAEGQVDAIKDDLGGQSTMQGGKRKGVPGHVSEEDWYLFPYAERPAPQDSGYIEDVGVGMAQIFGRALSRGAGLPGGRSGTVPYEMGKLHTPGFVPPEARHPSKKPRPQYPTPAPKPPTEYASEYSAFGPEATPVGAVHDSEFSAFQ